MNDTGPFDRILEAAPHDRNVRLIFAGMAVIGVALLILVLPPFSLLSGDDSTQSPPSGATSRNGAAGSSNVKLPKVPEGFEPLSRVFSLEKPKGTTGPYALTLNLAEPVTDGRNIGLYTNRNGKWERLASATLVNNGSAASGEVGEIPANLAVLRRTTSAAMISGWLPAGSQPDPAALDSLTTINPVDYTPNADGTLAGSATSLPSTKGNVMPTVRAAAQKDVDAVNTILASPTLRDAHINALLQIALLPANAGVDIDYRQITPARKADLTAFVTVLSERLHQSNRMLSLTLPAPTRAGVNWDTGAYDWEELGRRADFIKLAAEPDPSAYYARMEEVLNFLKSRGVDFKKVVLVVTRDSFEKATDGMRPLTLREGLTLASAIEVRTSSQITPNASVVIVGKNIFTEDGASGLRWDDKAFAVSFSYPGRGGQRTVWLENSLSFAFRLDLARRFGLAGVAVQSIALEPQAPDVWATLRSYAETGNVNLVQPNSALLRPTWQIQAGSSETNAKGTVVWKAPAQPGPYDVTLIVSDGVIRAAQKIVLEVRSPASPGATVSSSPTPGAQRPLASPTSVRP